MLPAVVAREVPTEHVEVFALRIVFDHRPRTHREAGADFDVLQILFPCRQRLVENIRLAMRRAELQPHAGFDETPLKRVVKLLRQKDQLSPLSMLDGDGHLHADPVIAN